MTDKKLTDKNNSITESPKDYKALYYEKLESEVTKTPDKKTNDNLSNNSPILSNSLSDNEIIKALEHYKGFRLAPYENYTDGDKCILVDDAIDLINRLQAENERLKGRINRLDDSYVESEKRCFELARVYHQYEKVMKNDAYKEFAESLKKKAIYSGLVNADIVYECDIDNLLKKLVGKENVS